MERLDAVAGDRSCLPLFGVPFAVKDNIDVATFDTTAACPAFRYRPECDAQVVSRLTAQGAIVVGKTNLDQFATGLVGTRSPFGIVRNSFDPRYIAGGSSSGSASVVARGLVPFALGTDTAGSGRVPAAFNNIVGWKPTRGAWSTSGVVPACRTLDCVSVFTLTVRDAEFIANLVEGYDQSDPYSRMRPTAAHSPHKPDTPSKLAIPDAPEFFGDEEAREAFEATVSVFAAAGAAIHPISFEPVRQLARLLYEGPWVAERLTVADALLSGDADQVEPIVRRIVEQGRTFSAMQTFRLEYRRAELAREIANVLDTFDALIVPTTPTVFTVDRVLADPVHTNSRLGTYTNFTNLADLCGLAVPGVFRANGLPAGVTLLAPAWNESKLARLGTTLEQRLALPHGATRRSSVLEDVPSGSEPPRATRVEIAVVGAHLSKLPLNPQLVELGGTLVKAARTSPNYRLYVLPHTTPIKPGMVRDVAGSAVSLEVWALSVESFGRFVSAIPAPLCIGNVELSDGSWVKGFLCEAHAVQGATDITSFGGFKEYLAGC
jgi:allophanate hydrolase